MNGQRYFVSPWWAFNSHVHTIVESQLIAPKNLDCERIEINTPDNDFLELDIREGEKERPVVALFHGLEGSSERFYIRNLMAELSQRGFSSIAMNFRGCGAKLNRQKRFYHSGETDDYKTLIEWISDTYPNRPIYVVGFSLGGNAMIKYLGEESNSAPVEKGVAVSPPYDLKLGSYNLQRGFNRVYEYRFMRTLRSKLELKRVSYPDLPKFSGSTIFDFDDKITAPVHGFKDAIDYYDSCSSKNFLGDVSVPLLLIHSSTDTLTPLEYAPFEVIEQSPFIETMFTKEGGHVGFISSPRNWLNKTIVSWLEAD